jgi:hypothetical protein
MLAGCYIIPVEMLPAFQGNPNKIYELVLRLVALTHKEGMSSQNRYRMSSQNRYRFITYFIVYGTKHPEDNSINPEIVSFTGGFYTKKNKSKKNKSKKNKSKKIKK